MAVLESKKRFTISIDKEIMKYIDEYAKEDKRSISNEIAYILSEYIKQRDKE